MHPRTVAPLVGAILLGALGLRGGVFQGGLLPVSEEGVLKKATALTVRYEVQGLSKSLTLTRPEELADLFSVLEFRKGKEDDRLPHGRRGGVKFHFPDGTIRELPFHSRSWLGESAVSPRF